MADLTGVGTITCKDPNGRPIVLDGNTKRRKGEFSIVIGDGASTYPVGGVPGPTLAQLGLSRQLDSLIINDCQGHAGYVPEYDKVNNKFKYFAETTVGTNQPLIEATNALVLAAATLTVTVFGW